MLAAEQCVPGVRDHVALLAAVDHDLGEVAGGAQAEGARDARRVERGQAPLRGLDDRLQRRRIEPPGERPHRVELGPGNGRRGIGCDALDAPHLGEPGHGAVDQRRERARSVPYEVIVDARAVGHRHHAHPRAFGRQLRAQPLVGDRDLLVVEAVGVEADEHHAVAPVPPPQIGVQPPLVVRHLVQRIGEQEHAGQAEAGLALLREDQRLLLTLGDPHRGVGALAQVGDAGRHVDVEREAVLNAGLRRALVLAIGTAAARLVDAHTVQRHPAAVDADLGARVRERDADDLRGQAAAGPVFVDREQAGGVDHRVGEAAGDEVIPVPREKRAAGRGG